MERRNVSVRDVLLLCSAVALIPFLLAEIFVELCIRKFWDAVCDCYWGARGLLKHRG
jgi:hypothetical protein